MANITSVKAVTDPTLRRVGIFVAVCGFVLLLTFNVAAVVVGLGAIVAGVLLARFGVRIEVIVVTGAAEQVCLRSRDATVALQVASAINLAIMKRSMR